jgi:hypothetical protein
MTLDRSIRYAPILCLNFGDWDLTHRNYRIEARLMIVLSVAPQGFVESAVTFSMN